MYVSIAMIDATFNEGAHYYWMPDVLLSTDMNCITQTLMMPQMISARSCNDMCSAGPDQKCKAQQNAIGK